MSEMSLIERVATPQMIAAAWGAWHSRHGGTLGPGPAFIEAISAAVRAMSIGSRWTDAEGREVVVVPCEPYDALLKSMAVRFDHGLGCPGYYDQPIFGADNVGHDKRLASTITTMRQLHEEVVGTGFYRLTP